jgi:hypothetical protein
MKTPQHAVQRIALLSLLALPGLSMADNANIPVTMVVDPFLKVVADSGTITDKMTMSYNPETDQYTAANKKIHFITNNINNGVKMTFKDGDIIKGDDYKQELIVNVRLAKKTWLEKNGSEELAANVMNWKADRTSDSFDLEVQPKGRQDKPAQDTYNGTIQLEFAQLS